MAWMLAMLLMTGPISAPDTVVVCPQPFRPALEEWLDYRQQQGHVLAVVAPDRPEVIREAITAIAQGGRLQYVVLAGDVPGQGLAAELAVSTWYSPATVNVEYGSETTIASDSPYGDLDADGVPELAVGRIPADTPEQLRQILAKTIAYERSGDFGPWRRRVQLVAGVGGFGALVDRAIESATRFFVQRELPPGLAVSVAQASWQSPFCPGPPWFQAETIQQLNEGAWFWVYMGHGRHTELDRVASPEGAYPILSTDEVSRLDAAHGPPVAVFLACYTGAFDAREDCLAEQMLARRGGPVAVLAASRVSMPYGMAVLAHGLMGEVFQRRAATLGLAVLEAKRRSVADPPADDASRTLIDSMAGALSPRADLLAEERAEHVEMFNLLGDPLLRLHHPEPVELHLPGEVEPGASLTVEGISPLEGVGRLELAVPRGQLTFRAPQRETYPQTPAEWNAYHDVYRRAGDDRLAARQLALQAGPFSVELPIPADAKGPCVVRVFVEGEAGWAVGAAELTVHQAAPAGR